MIMDFEVNALLDHAELCREVAAETLHEHAKRRLIDLAVEYEGRARTIAASKWTLKRNPPVVV
jgi:hypothetical protein